MSTPTSGDLLLVNRGGSNYQIDYDDMSTLQDTDLLLVNRGGVNYQVEAQYVASGNGEIIEPVEVLSPVNNAGISRYTLSDAIVDVANEEDYVVFETDPIQSVTGIPYIGGPSPRATYSDNAGGVYTDEQVLKSFDGDESTGWDFDQSPAVAGLDQERWGTITFDPPLQVNDKLELLMMPTSRASSANFTRRYRVNNGDWVNMALEAGGPFWRTALTGPGTVTTIDVGGITENPYAPTIYQFAREIKVDGKLLNAQGYLLQLSSSKDVDKFQVGDHVQGFATGSIRAQYITDTQTIKLKDQENVYHTIPATYSTNNVESLDAFFAEKRIRQVTGILLESGVSTTTARLYRLEVNGIQYEHDERGDNTDIAFSYERGVPGSSDTNAQSWMNTAGGSLYVNCNTPAGSYYSFDFDSPPIPPVEIFVTDVDTVNNIISVDGGDWGVFDKSRVWSDGLTASGVIDQAVTNAFNNDSSNYARSADNAALFTLTFDPPLAVSSSIELASGPANDTGFTATIDGYVYTTSGQTVTITGTGALSEITIQNNNSNGRTFLEYVKVDGALLVDTGVATGDTSVLKQFFYDARLTVAGNTDLDVLSGQVRMSDGVADNNGNYPQTPYTLNMGNVVSVSKALDNAAFSTNQGTSDYTDWDQAFLYSSASPAPALLEGQWKQIDFNPALPKGTLFEIHGGNSFGGVTGITINGVDLGNVVPNSESWSTDDWFDATSLISGDRINSIRVRFQAGVEWGRVNGIRIDGRKLLDSDLVLGFDSESPDLQYLEREDPLQTHNNWLRADWSGTNVTSHNFPDQASVKTMFDGNPYSTASYSSWTSGIDIRFSGMPTGGVGDYIVKCGGTTWWDGGPNTVRYVSVTVYTTEGSTSYSGGGYGTDNLSNPLPLPIGGQLYRISSGRGYPYRTVGISVGDIWFQGKQLVDSDVDNSTSNFMQPWSEPNTMLVTGGSWYADPANGGDGSIVTDTENPPLNQNEDWSTTVVYQGGSRPQPIGNLFDGKINRRNGLGGTTYINAGSASKLSYTFANPIPFASKVEVNARCYPNGNSSGTVFITDSGGAGGASRDVPLVPSDGTYFDSYNDIRYRTDVTDLLVSPILGFGINNGTSALLSGIHIDGRLLVDQDVYDTGEVIETAATYQLEGGEGQVVHAEPNTNTVYVRNNPGDNVRWIKGSSDLLGQPGNTGGTADPVNAIDFFVASPQAVGADGAVDAATVTFTTQNAGTTPFTSRNSELTLRTWTLETGPSEEGPWSVVGVYYDSDMNASQDGATPWQTTRPTLVPNTFYRVKCRYDGTNTSEDGFVESDYNVFKTGA